MYDLLIAIGYTHHEICLLSEAIVMTSHYTGAWQQANRLALLMAGETIDEAEVRDCVDKIMAIHEFAKKEQTCKRS